MYRTQSTGTKSLLAAILKTLFFWELGVFVARRLLVSIDCVLCILKSYYAYEKRSPDVGESNDIKNGDIRRVNRIICKEKVIFIDFQKLIPRFLRSVFQSFWHPYPKTPLHGYFTCVKKIFEGSNQKSASTVLSGMFWRIKNIYTSWPYLLTWRNAPKKLKKSKTASLSALLK